jgi:NAD(P)-dependent dehydrogenase (short-subunit alcohol dehydrogenase family)
VTAGRFAGRVAIVTGGASGIGLAIVKAFSREGATVVVADLHGERASQVADEVKANGSAEAWGVACDVSKEQDVDATVQGTLDRFGHLDIVVNNAGLMVFRPLEEHTAEDWLRVLHVDLLGTFFFTRAAFRTMKPGGAIVNISSIHAVETTPLVSSYAAAKAAVLSLTRSASMEGKPKGIRVNAILPGAIDTPMLWENPNIRSGVEVIDRKDVGKPEEVAATVLFLASEEASFVQGEAMRVDGGRLNRL